MTSLCSLHADQASVGACPTCSRPFCARCRVEDLARDRTYCSTACRDVAGAVAPGASRPASELVQDLRTPIRAGWRLWLRSAGPLTLQVALPVGVTYSALRYVTLGAEPVGDASSAAHDAGAVALAALAAAASAVMLSRAHTGAPGGLPWTHVLARLLPWAAVWVFYLAAVFVGSLLLIVPGIIAGIRLFWADEFALVHGMGPVAAVKESLQLTRGQSSRIFSFQFLLGFAEYAVLLPLFVGFVAVGGLLSVLPPGGIATFAFGTLSSILLTHAYASAHAPEIVYFYGLRALRAGLSEEERAGDWVTRGLHEAEGAAGKQRCRACGAFWDPADYRADVATIYCSRCKEPLQRPAPAATPG